MKISWKSKTTLSHFLSGLEKLELCMLPIIVSLGRIFGRILVTIAICLISSIALMFQFVIMPVIIKETNNIFLILFIFVCGYWLLINIAFNYYMALMTDPGSPSVDSVSEKTCVKCNMPKPYRTHHCSICKRCILRMDHHCPWINNCVGFYNHRFFFLFCVFTSIGCIYFVFFTMTYYFPHLYKTDSHQNPLSMPNGLFWRVLKPLLVGPPRNMRFDQIMIKFTFPVISSAICFSLSFVLIGFSLFHFYLISKNDTTIDNDGWLFNLGVRRNWMRLFDVCDHWQLLRRIVLPCSKLPRFDKTVGFQINYVSDV